MTQPPTPSALRAFLDAVLEQPEHERTLRWGDWRRGAAASVAIGALAAGACDGPSRGVAIYGIYLEQERDCINRVDDDGDGAVDCDDTADCCRHPNCVGSSSCRATTGGGPHILTVTEFDCADGIDDDDDGRTDCDDPDCAANAACRGAGGAAGAGSGAAGGGAAAGASAGSAGRGGAE